MTASTDARYAEYAEKEPTSLQAHMAEWIPEVTGIDVTQFEDVQTAFEEGVRLSVALRMEYQRSPENRERTAAEREEREEEEQRRREERAAARAKREEEAEAKRAQQEEERKARLAEREAKQKEREEAAAAKKSKVADEDVEDDEEDDAEEAAPVAKTAKRPGPTKRAGKTRPAPTTSKAGDEDLF